MQLQGKYPKLFAKTANFTVDPTTTRCGTLFTNKGAGGAVTFTLPQLSGSAGGTWDGYWLEFFAEADQTVTVACTATKAITFNNAAATSLALSTGGQKIGGRIRAIWNAATAKWILSGVSVGHTYTVA
jgi:hypothetical protein